MFILIRKSFLNIFRGHGVEEVQLFISNGINEFMDPPFCKTHRIKLVYQEFFYYFEYNGRL